MSVKGKVWKYGDDVNTDVIFPGKYTYTIKERADMAKVALEDLDMEFNKNAKPGDIIVGGKNWGCGSSREQAVTCIKERGIAVIIAKSFARIYYRNCFNEGLPIIVCPEAVDAISMGDEVESTLKRRDNCKRQRVQVPSVSGIRAGAYKGRRTYPPRKEVSGACLRSDKGRYRFQAVRSRA